MGTNETEVIETGDAEETAAILDDPETMAAIAEGDEPDPDDED